MQIAARFWLVLGVVAVAMGVMGFFGFGGLRTISDSAGGLRNVVDETDRDNRVRADAARLAAAVELRITADDPALAQEIRAEVEATVARLEVGLAQARRDHADRPADLRFTVEQERGVAQLVAQWRSDAFHVDPTGSGADARKARLVRRVRRLVAPMVRAGDRLAAHNVDIAARAGANAGRTYGATRDRMIVIFAATLAIGAGMVLWLIRTVVPRTRRYSSFAARISAGDLAGRLDARGGDELADLGRSLDAMVDQQESDREYRRAQAEFADALQVTENEQEAHGLLKVHLQRSIRGSEVVVLNRNNSDDRLEARTEVAAGSALAEGLDGAAPRSCLAVRFGRRHEGGGGRDPLVSCTVCGKSGDLVTCSPLLVGGEVIGSVLVSHERELDGQAGVRIRESVTQAAPVLANLRNLAIAEMRASTDALTGLPNSRAVRDTVKRMVAQAARTQAPLGVALLDLDHFKQINDTYGHGHGDEVLAAVGTVMRAAVRDADFVGRYGGEEFLILLPETDPEGALIAMEKVRNAVAQIALPTVGHAITASIGLAVMPDNGLDTETLVRNADRALYVAKSRGRDRVEAVGALAADPPLPTAP